MSSALHLFALAAGMAAGILLDIKPSDALMPVLVPIGMAFFAAMAVATMSIAVRRLHDRGRSGYWLVPYRSLPSMTIGSAGLDGPGLVAT